jgi:hypothetical protein
VGGILLKAGNDIIGALAVSGRCSDQTRHASDAPEDKGHLSPRIVHACALRHIDMRRGQLIHRLLF